MSVPNTDRILAKEEGRKFYISPTPCKKCGCVVKFVSSYGCHYCAKKKGYEKLMSGVLEKYHTAEKTNARVQKWRKNNPEMTKAQQRREYEKGGGAKAARYRTSKRDQTPVLTEQQEQVILDLYKEARRLSSETSIPHEVDHIKPVSKGGLHHPDNLQILTRGENRRKSDKF